MPITIVPKNSVVTIRQYIRDILVSEGSTTLVKSPSIRVATAGYQGPPGPQGIQGIQGPIGLTGTSYVHTQAIALDTWVIVHSLNRFPSVTVVDSAGTHVIGDVQYTDSNTITLTFVGAFSGVAYLN
jgi:hypothetical protein